MPALQDIIKDMEKKRGKMFYAGDQGTHDYYRIPTGIFSADYMMGGGIPVGVTSCVWGPASGGKSTYLAKLHAGAQMICWNCFKYQWECSCPAHLKKHNQKVVHVDAEHSLDLNYSEALGVDPDRLIVVKPDCGEQASDAIIAVLSADDVCLVTLDSIGAMVPQKELEGSAYDANYALQARLMATTIRKVKATLITRMKAQHRVAFFAINQIRAKMGVTYGLPEEVPGGNVSKHDWHISCRSSQVKGENDSSDKSQVRVAKFNLSLGSPGMSKRKLLTLAGSAEYLVVVSSDHDLPFGAIDDYKIVQKYAKAGGVLRKEGNVWLFGNGAVEYRTEAEVIREWYDDPQVFLSAKKAVVDSYVSAELARREGMETVSELPTEDLDDSAEGGDSSGSTEE